MKNCPNGYKISNTDIHKRCVKIINRSVCSKMGKEFNSKTRKCRIACTARQERINRKDGRGSRCRKLCGVNEERGKRYCRATCKSTQKRVRRRDRRGTRCVNK